MIADVRACIRALAADLLVTLIVALLTGAAILS